MLLSSMRCRALRPADLLHCGLSCSASASSRGRHARRRSPDAGGSSPRNSSSRMTTTWPRYREECEQSYAACAYTHDCGQHMIEQEGRRLGSGNGAFAGDSFPRPPHSGAPGELPASEGPPSSGKASSRERQKRHGEGERREEKRREHRSERHLRREAIDPSPPPPPPPEQPEQPKQAAPTLGSNIVNLPSTAADCVDCAAAQAQAAHIQALPNGQPGMEVIESINPGKCADTKPLLSDCQELESFERGLWKPVSTDQRQ